MLSYLNNREHSNFPVSAQADQVELISARSTNKHTIAQTPSSTSVTYLIKLNATSEILAAAHGNHSIGIYQANTGRLVAQCVGHTKSPWTLNFHPSNPYMLASGCLDGFLKLWNLAEIADEIENPTRNYDDPVTIGPCESWQHFGAISSIDFHPIKDMLVAVHTFDIVFYDLVSRRPMTVWRFAKDHSRVKWVKFNNSGSALYTATSNKILENKFDKDYPLVEKKIPREKALSHLLSDLKFLDELNFCESCLIKILLWASCLASNDYQTGKMDLKFSFDNLNNCLREKELSSAVELLRQFMENKESISSNMNPLSVIVLEELNEDFKRIEDLNENELFYLWSHRQLMRFSLCRCCLDKIWSYVNSFMDWGFDAHANNCYGIPKSENESPVPCNNNDNTNSKDPESDYNQKEVNQVQSFLSDAHLISPITFNSYEIFANIFNNSHCQLCLPHIDFNFNPITESQEIDSDEELSSSTTPSSHQPFKKPRLASGPSHGSCSTFDSYTFENSSNDQDNHDLISYESSISSQSSCTLSLVDPVNIMRQFQNIEASSRSMNVPRLVDMNLNHYQSLMRNGEASDCLEKFKSLSEGYQKLQEILNPAKKELMKPFDERLSVSEASITNPVIHSNQSRVINDRLAQVMTEDHGAASQTYSDMTCRVCRWELEYKTITQEISFQDILINHKNKKQTSDTHLHVTYKSNALVIQNSRIFNDSSLRLSSCGKYLAALVTLNEKNIYEKQYLSGTMDTFVAVFRTEPLDHRGKCIYGRRFGPLNSPVCLDFSPSAQHLVVGFATQRFKKNGTLDFENMNPIGRIFRLNSRLNKDKIIERNLAEAGFIVHPSMADCFISYSDNDDNGPTQNNTLYISHLKNYFQNLVTNPMNLSMNSIVWKPDGGLVYGTTKGLVLLVGNESATGAVSLNSLRNKKNYLNKIVSLDSVEKNSNLIFRENPNDEKNTKRREISTHQSFFSKFATVIQQEATSSIGMVTT